MRSAKSETLTRLLQLPVLGFCLLQDGNVGSASFLLCFLQEHDIGIVVSPQNSKAFAVW